MNGYLVDTNVISEFVKASPCPSVTLWLQNAAPDTLFASVMTVGEIRLGIENLPAGKRRTDLESWLETGLPGLLPTSCQSLDLLPTGGED
jgi:predicted nucleic acid-binding protein